MLPASGPGYRTTIVAQTAGPWRPGLRPRRFARIGVGPRSFQSLSHTAGEAGRVSTVLVWSIAIGAIAGVLFRPREWPEAIWACLGAALLVVCRLISVPKAGAAIAKGADVYLFLTGMMMLAELARQKGVFDWLAGLAVGAAAGSQTRLFTLIYGVGILVTAFLSNDATAVVL